MTSQKQIEANRANARKSTGPRTPDGKAISARNALRHGLTAKSAVVRGEKFEVYEEFTRGVFEDLAPVGAVEAALAEFIADSMWRLRRALKAESQLANDCSSWAGDVPNRNLYRDDNETSVKICRHESHLSRLIALHMAQFQALQRIRLEREQDPAIDIPAVILNPAPS